MRKKSATNLDINLPILGCFFLLTLISKKTRRPHVGEDPAHAVSCALKRDGGSASGNDEPKIEWL